MDDVRLRDSRWVRRVAESMATRARGGFDPKTTG